METQTVPLLIIKRKPDETEDYAPYLIQSVTTIFVGHLGDLELSAVSLAHNVIGNISYGFLQGMAIALGTLCGQAYGAGQVGSLGIYLQRSWIVLSITSVILSSAYIYATPILMILGQDPRIANLAGKYSRKILPEMFSSTLNLSTQKFLQAQSKVGVITWMAFAALIAQTGLLHLFINIFGWGLDGAAAAYNITNWGIAIGQGSEDMQRAVARLAYLLGVTMLLNSATQVLTGVAVGGGWQVMVAYINLGCYYLFGLPLAILLGFKAKLGAMGLWGGMMSGSALHILFLLILTSRTNWDNEVKETTKRIKKWGNQEKRTDQEDNLLKL
ncbi:PREDICTED: protein TRANSPARENT TESTA 12-like [Fragaria vesca subsp. vesca]